MKIKKVSVKNLGIYRDKWKFDLSTATKEKPIVLFGGLNGAGKTTLFDGIRLCLYGKNIFKRISENSYQEYLKDKIHRPNDNSIKIDNAKVELIFEIVEDSKIIEYQIKRIWEYCDDCIVEKLHVVKDGEKFDEIQENLWQDYINELIPIGVSQLFFFDGEKIQNIISDSDNIEFISSVKSLLGIDIIERLQADITIYRNRKLKAVSSDSDKQKLHKLDKDIANLENTISRQKDSQSSLMTKILRLEDELKRYKNKIIAQGGAFFDNQNQLVQRRQKLENDLENVREKLRELCSNSLPVVIADKLADRFKEQLIKEQDIQENRVVERRLDSVLEDILEGDKYSGISKDVIEKLKKALKSSNPNKENLELFGFSANQTNSLVIKISQRNFVKDDLNKLSNEYEIIFRKLQEIQKNINSIPAEEMLKGIYEKSAELNNKLGSLHAQKSHLDKELTNTYNLLQEFQTRRQKILKTIDLQEKSEQKIELTRKVDSALKSYKVKIAQKRIERLQKEFLLTFNSLHRKGDLVHDVAIDPEVFLITMFDLNGKEISINDLSSGEKEIYAIALLHALAKSSGMNLPFIIDTPLGRLDSAHRSKLVEMFFPKASHQMVVFSTDSEIGREYYEKLEPYICASYNLNYDNKTRSSQVKQGYLTL